MSPIASPPLERVQLNNRSPVSRTTIHGWPSVLLGLPFAAMGTFILLMGLGKIEVSADQVHAPLWVIALCGLMFLLAGLFFVGHGLDGVRRKAKLKQVQITRASSPWLWDYEWHPLGISDNKLKKVLHALLMLIVVGAFLVPFHWWAFFSNDGRMMVKIMVVFFDLVFGLAGGYYFINNLALYLKYGNSRLRFGTFPFYLGDSLSVTLIDLPSEFRQLQLDLRFIEEKYETRGRGRNKDNRVVCYQLFHESRTLEGSEIISSGKVSLEWDLPSEPDMTSSLSRCPARFWELEVKADTAGVDYHCHFLLPVYARGT